MVLEFPSSLNSKVKSPGFVDVSGKRFQEKSISFFFLSILLVIHEKKPKEKSTVKKVWMS